MNFVTENCKYFSMEVNLCGEKSMVLVW